MSFFELSQAMAPFSIFCLFYFYYRVGKLEKFLLLYEQKSTREKKMMADTIDKMGERIANLENILMQFQVVEPSDDAIEDSESEDSDSTDKEE